MAVHLTAQALPADDLQSGVSPRAVLAVLRRRRGHFLLALTLVFSAFAAAAFLLPARYRSDALVEAVPGIGDAQNPAPALDPQVQMTRIQELLGQRSVLEEAARQLPVPVAGSPSRPASDADV